MGIAILAAKAGRKSGLSLQASAIPFRLCLIGKAGCLDQEQVDSFEWQFAFVILDVCY